MSAPHRPRRLLLRVTLALLVLLLLTWITRNLWLRPLAVQIASRALDATITADALTLDTPTTLTATNLHATSHDGSWTASIPSASARIAPLALLRGNLAGVQHLTLTDPTLTLRPRNRTPRPSRPPLRALPPLPTASITGATLTLDLDERSLALAGIDLTLTGPPTRRNATLRVSRATLTDPRTPLDLADLTLAADITPTALEDLHLRTPTTALLADAHLAFAGGALELTATLPALDTTLTATRDATTTTARAGFAALDLANLPVALDLRGHARGTLELALPNDAPSAFTATADVELTAPCIAGRTLDHATLRGAFTAARATIDQLSATRGRDRFIAHRLDVPLALSDAHAWLRDARGTLELDVRDLPALVAPWVELASDALPAHHLEARLALDAGRATIESASFTSAGGTATVRRGTLTLPEDAPADASAVELLRRARVDLEAQVDLDDLATLGALVSTSRWSGTLRGSVRVEGPLEAARGDAELDARGLVVEGRPLGDATLRARLAARRITLHRLDARTPYGALAASGTFDLAARELADVEFELESAVPTRAWTPWLATGAVRARASLDGPLERPRGALALDAGEVRLAGRALENVRLRARSGADGDGSWTIDTFSACAGELELALRGSLAPEHASPVRTGDAVRAGDSVRAWRARLESLELAWRERSLHLDAPVGIELAPERFAIQPFSLSGTAGRVHGRAAHERGNWEAHLALAQLGDVGLAEWLPGVPIACDDATGEIEIHGGGDDLAVRLALDVARVNCSGRDAEEDELMLSVRAGWARSRLSIETLALDAPTNRVRVTGEVPLGRGSGSGELELHAEWDVEQLAVLPVRLYPPLARLRGSASGALDLAGTWSEPRLDARVDVAGLEQLWVRSEWSDDELTARGPFDAHVELAFAQALALTRARVRGPGGLDLELEGRVDVPLSEVLAGAPRERLVQAPLVLRARARVEDLTRYSRQIPAVRRLSGSIDADVALAGTLAKPSLDGGLAIEDGALRLTAEIPPLSALRGRLAFAGTRATLEGMRGRLGAGPFELSGALDWSDPELLLHVELAGEQLLLARTPSLRLRADARLVFDGPLAEGASTPGTLRGDLTLRDGRYVRDFDLLAPLRRPLRGAERPSVERREIGFFSLTGEPLASAEFDVRVGGESFQIVNNLLRATLLPELTIRGTGASPELEGTLFLERGTLLLPAGAVDLRSGSVAFDRRDPLVPRLDLHGAARFAGYDVTLAATGPYDDLEIQLSSTPVLSNSDLMLLALSGRAPSQGGGDDATVAAQSLATFLGRDYLSRTFRDGGGEEGFWSRVEFRQGREVTRSGGQTSELTVDLTGGDLRGHDPDARRAVYLRGERDAYDRVNFGVRFVFRSR